MRNEGSLGKHRKSFKDGFLKEMKVGKQLEQHSRQDK